MADSNASPSSRLGPNAGRVVVIGTLVANVILAGVAHLVTGGKSCFRLRTLLIHTHLTAPDQSINAGTWHAFQLAEQEIIQALIRRFLGNLNRPDCSRIIQVKTPSRSRYYSSVQQTGLSEMVYNAPHEKV